MSTQSSEPRQDRVIPLAGGADSAGEWIYVSTAEARARGRRPSPLARSCAAGQVRSGQVYYSAEVEDHESHKAAYATSEHRLLKSSYARIVT